MSTAGSTRTPVPRPSWAGWSAHSTQGAFAARYRRVVLGRMRDPVGSIRLTFEADIRRMPQRRADQPPCCLPPNCLPLRVLIRQAHGAWPIPGRDGGLLVGEEHAIPDVPAACDGTARGRAVEPAVDAAQPVAAERAGGGALVWLPVGAQQRVRSGGPAALSRVSRPTTVSNRGGPLLPS